MKNKFFIIITTILSVASFFISCTSNEKEPYVSGNTIYIKYMQPVEPGDWIKINNQKFIHTIADTVGQGSNPNFIFDVFNQDSIRNNPDIIWILSTLQYSNGGGSGLWLPEYLSGGEIAIDLVKKLLNSEVARESKIKIGGNSYTIASGEIILSSDQDKIKVSTSSNYPAYVGKVSFEEYLKIQAQKKK